MNLANTLPKIGKLQKRFSVLRDAKVWQSCRARKMLPNESVLLRSHEETIADFKTIVLLDNEFGAVRKCAHLVELENCCQTHT